MPECPGLSELDRYHTRELTGDDLLRVESHIRSCPRCADHLAAAARQEEALVDDLRELNTRFLGDAAGAAAAEPSPSPDDANLDAETHKDSGLRIAGYTIIREIHRGGQGVVYLAAQRATRRKVAVKVLLDGSLASPATRKRFEREVALAAQLKHPNIITIFDSGVTEDGHQYCVMDYVQGDPLATHVRKNRLALEEALKLFALVCRGVHYAHQHGVIHRDLKSSNILVDTVSADATGSAPIWGTPRILDFGLAKSISNPSQSIVSMTGQIFGTLPYMAPEQVSGDSDRVDARADVYALGVVLYEMLTGRYPYPVDGQLSDTLKHITDTNPAPPRQAWTSASGIHVTRVRGRAVKTGACPIDDEIETILLRCLAKERERRYQSAEALANDVDRYLTGEAIQAKRESRMYMLRKSLPRHKLRMAIGVAFLIAVASSAVVYTQVERIHEQRAQARATLIRQAQDAILVMDAKRLDELMDQAAVLELDAANYECYRGWARLLELDTDGTIAAANRALAVDPNHAMSYFLRAATHAYTQNYVGALADFTKGQQYKGDTILEEGVNAMLKTLLGQYESGVKDLDDLVHKHKGMAAPLWIRGFSRWYRLLTDPPRDIEERWQLAKLSLRDLDAAAQLYPTVPFVFDVRADLFNHMALMSRARKDERGYEEYLSRRAADAQTMKDLNALGNGDVVLSNNALHRGDFQEARRLAVAAYADLTKPSSIRSVNRGDALAFSIVLGLWSTWLMGDDAESLALLAQLSEAHPKLTGYFFYGFITAACANPATPSGAALRDRLLSDKSDLGLPTFHWPFGQWAGAKIRGDDELADHVARRFSVGLLDRFGWSGVWARYMRKDASTEDLLRAAGDNVDNIQIAHLTIGLASNDSQQRARHLQAAMATASPGFIWIAVEGLALREEKLAKP